MVDVREEDELQIAEEDLSMARPSEIDNGVYSPPAVIMKPETD